MTINMSFEQEIIQYFPSQAPNYAEPFQALSMFYEDLGDYEKSYELSLVAAYLSPQDADEWLRLAEVCLSRNDTVQASKCLAKAVQADPSNLQIHQRYAQPSRVHFVTVHSKYICFA